jgi:S1-C subfamily serine protease
VEGEAIRGPSALIAVIAAHKPGEKQTPQIQRGSSALAVTATLVAQPSQPPAA